MPHNLKELNDLTSLNDNCDHFLLQISVEEDKYANNMSFSWQFLQMDELFKLGTKRGTFIR